MDPNILPDGRQPGTVNPLPTGRQVDRLSEQQREVLDAIARLEPQGLAAQPWSRWRAPSGSAGCYDPKDVSAALGAAYDRSRQASIARAMTRLEARGLIRRHRYADPTKTGRSRFFTLSAAGLVVVNEIRYWFDLPPVAVEVWDEPPPMTEEEFDRRLQAIELDAVKARAAKLRPAGLEELRRWIDAWLAESGRLANG
jgi:DNA-binding PadR family transcriptional regulator